MLRRSVPGKIWFGHCTCDFLNRLRLSDLEKTRTLEALVGQLMKEDLDAMSSLSRDFNTSIEALMYAVDRAKKDPKQPALQKCKKELMDVVFDFHDEFI